MTRWHTGESRKLSILYYAVILSHRKKLIMSSLPFKVPGSIKNKIKKIPEGIFVRKMCIAWFDAQSTVNTGIFFFFHLTKMPSVLEIGTEHIVMGRPLSTFVHSLWTVCFPSTHNRYPSKVRIKFLWRWNKQWLNVLLVHWLNVLVRLTVT